MATELNCSACDELRQEAPNFVINGLGEEECASLMNDTGLEPSAGHDDCTDLNNMNDCLIGTMEKEVSSYAICDWKSFMKAFIPNLWTMLKGMICAICGIWTKLNCAYDSIVALTNAIGSTVGAKSFVRYYRDNSGTGEGYQWDIQTGNTHTLNIYMDADLDNGGSQAADRDYVVIISNCTDIHNTSNCAVILTFYSSGDGRPIATIRKRQGQHPTIVGTSVDDFSWTTSGAILIKKGEHVKVEAYIESGSAGWFRLHQFTLTWIPVNVEKAIDPSEILKC